jgi:prolyl oligopeptidase
MTPLPPTRRDDVVDHLHGVDVADPYRWLEDGESAEVQAWVATQNGRSRQALDARPDRPWWHQRLVELMQRSVVMAVQVRGGRLFCLERPAGTEQFVLTRRSALDPLVPATVLLDPAVGTADAANAIDWFDASPDGSLVALGTSEGGSEESVLRVIDGGDGTDQGEAIPDTRACSVAWEPDSSGFAYTRYPAGDQYHRTVHHHVLGTEWRDDPVVWADHPTPQAWPDVAISPDGKWLVVHVLVGWARFDVHVLERATGRWTTAIAGREVTTVFEFAADGTSLVGVTTLDAPKGRVVRAPLAAANRWETLVAEGDAVLGRVAVRGDDLLVVSTARAVDHVVRYDPDGRPLGSVDGLGEVVAVSGLSADRTTGDAFAVIDSFEAPTSLWRIPGGSSAAVPWSSTAVANGGAVPALDVTQLTYPSLDGTPIGLFLIHRADISPGVDVPAILNGYGGFAIA